MTTNPNPKIRCVKIGKREIREIEVLPLSVADQFKLSDLLNEAIGYAVALTGNEAAIIAALIGLIRRNLDRILEMATEEPQCRGLRLKWINLKRRIKGKEPLKPILDMTTNDQAWEIAEAIYQMNYEDLLKKVQSLLKKRGIPDPLRRLSQYFSDIIPSTASKISTEEPGEKAE